MVLLTSSTLKGVQRQLIVPVDSSNVDFLRRVQRQQYELFRLLKKMELVIPDMNCLDSLRRWRCIFFIFDPYMGILVKLDYEAEHIL